MEITNLTTCIFKSSILDNKIQIQNTNTKSLFHNGGHRPIIQSSHNTILTMSGKLEISYLSYLIRLGKILFKLVSWKSVFMVLTHNKSSTRVAR